MMNGQAGEVINACLEVGVREFVVCAGARNLALVEALVQSEEAVIWSHFEERAAGFFALGRSMDSREPCAVVTTSGTAVAELLPAVVEAYYQGRPLVLITADRPQSYRGTGAPQAIEQVGIFSHYVEASCDIADTESAAGCFEGWTGQRPWQLNVCLEEHSAAQLVAAGNYREFQPLRENFDVSPLIRFFDDFWAGVVVCLGGLEPEDREEVWSFLKEIQVPVVADPTSGLRELLGPMAIADPERVLAVAKPRKVLRLGEVPVGRYWRDLESQADIEVLSITRTGMSGLSRPSQVIKGSVARILRGAGEIGQIGDVLDILKLSKRRQSEIDRLLETYPDSEPGMLRTLSVYATVADSLYLGNSLPIREWGQFCQREYPIEYVRANRGANGIDGQIATWAGLTHGLDDAWCVVGDLTALYDLSAPSLLHGCDAVGRVLVVVNNGGGRIFERLPRVRKLAAESQDLIANSHGFSFEPWAAMWGFGYLSAESADSIEIEPGAQTMVVELVPDEEQTKAFWEAYEGLSFD